MFKAYIIILKVSNNIFYLTENKCQMILKRVCELKSRNDSFVLIV